MAVRRTERVERTTVRWTVRVRRVVKPGLAWGWRRVGEGKKAPLSLLGWNFSSCVQPSTAQYSDHTPVYRTEWTEPQSVETCRSEKRASQAESIVLFTTEIFLSS